MDVVIAARICAASPRRADRRLAGDARRLGRGAARGCLVPRARSAPAEGRARTPSSSSSSSRPTCGRTSRRSRRSRPRAFRRSIIGSSGASDALARVERLLGDQGARLVTITGPGRRRKEPARARGRGRRGARADPCTSSASRRSPMPSSFRARSRARSACASRAASRSQADRRPARGHRRTALPRQPRAPRPARRFTSQRSSTARRICRCSRRAARRSASRPSTSCRSSHSTIEDATTLFVELAAARGVVLQADALASVHEICRRLDGLPLAIELVAARLVVLPPAEIVRALEEGLALEMEGPIDLPERQRTLRAAIDWSYGRLTESQRALHGTLAVFSDERVARRLARSSPRLRRRSSPTSRRSSAGAWCAARRRDGSRPPVDARNGSRACSRSPSRRAASSTTCATVMRSASSSSRSTPRAGSPARIRPRGSIVSSSSSTTSRAALDWLLSVGPRRGRARAISALERFWRGHAHMTRHAGWLAHAGSSRRRRPSHVRADALWAAARFRQRHRATGRRAERRCSRRRLPLIRSDDRERGRSRSPSSASMRSAGRPDERRRAVARGWRGSSPSRSTTSVHRRRL